MNISAEFKKSWFMMYGEVYACWKENGVLPKHRKRLASNSQSMGLWIQTQKMLLRRPDDGNLDSVQKQMLKEIGIVSNALRQ